MEMQTAVMLTLQDDKKVWLVVHSISWLNSVDALTRWGRGVLAKTKLTLTSPPTHVTHKILGPGPARLDVFCSHFEDFFKAYTDIRQFSL